MPALSIFFFNWYGYKQRFLVMDAKKKADFEIIEKGQQ
jgi:hypothetical protein